ncbi:MAG: ABC transporter ATP-binding protein [Tropicimonas sp.]|uniref:ABC transporter ATP-binding protein n=1 Tax=Tropicimonas sp. TaxID=2067044 RepID=UPI003A8BAA19
MFDITGPALRRGGNRVLGAFSFSVAPGEMLGVVGPNGTGKSTLLRAIAGLAPETVPVTREGRRLGRRDIGHLPQAFAVKSSISVLECVLLGRREELGLRIPAGLIDEAEGLLARLGLAPLADRPMSALSGGQQQRVLITQRLFRTPALMLLDEPTSALDLHHQLSALSALSGYVRQSGAAVIVAMHDLTLAARYCDRIMLVAGGECGAPDLPAKILTRETVSPLWRIDPEFLTCRAESLVIVPHAIPEQQA